MAKLWEEGIDYSAELQRTDLTPEQRSQYEAARTAKIADLYGGVEPTMANSTQTFSDLYTGTGGAVNAKTTNNQYAGTNYHQDAIDAAKAGNWDLVTEVLGKREDKVGATGENYGKTSAEIYAELMAQYGKKTPEYDSKYSTQIDALLNSILNRSEFTYDYKTDPSYLAYEDKYKRLGERAREDTLGDVAGLTGGLPSSWAVSAASQAQNDYNQQLSDIIPTLYDAAYNRYMDDYNMDVTNLGLLQGVDNTYYDRYRDTVADSQWQDEYDYKKERDEVADSQWQTTFDWNKTVDEFNMGNEKISQAMVKWQMLGVADAEIAKALGVPEGATTESYYFNKLSADQAKQEADKVDALEASIARNAANLMDGIDGWDNAAKYILGAVSSADEYYRVGKMAGVPTAVLEDIFDKHYNEVLNGGDDDVKDYAYYAAQMGSADDPEAWLETNKYSIPADILADLYKLLDY